MKTFYVLGRNEDNGSHWVLGLEAKSLANCKRDIAWQCVGGSSESDWVIAKWDRERKAFFAHPNGETPLLVRQGIYTAKAWNGFMSQLDHVQREERWFRVSCREARAIGRFEDKIFSVAVPITGSYHVMAEAAIKEINARGYEVLHIMSHSSKLETL